jgi:NADH-quinone oxidoreductase subunit A
VTGYLGSYATLGLLILGSALLFVVAFGANRVLRPRHPADSPGKWESYECGVDPVGGDWAQAHIRYYVYAYLYVLFAVESVFLFPWAVVFDRPGFGVATVIEMGIFVGLLALGLLYAWRKRVLLELIRLVPDLGLPIRWLGFVHALAVLRDAGLASAQ